MFAVIGCLMSGVWYLLCLPAGYLFLIIYSFCNLNDHRPQTEIARKLYRQATNKIAGISAAAARYLSRHF